MTAAEPTAASIRLLPVQATMHKVIAALHGHCFDDAWNAYTVGQVMRMPGAFGFLAVSGDENGTGDMPTGFADTPIGFALASGAADERELLSIGVLPDHRRSGVGRRLVEMVIAAAIERGAARLFLEVAEDNVPAQQLYQRLGFIAVGRRPGYYRRKTGPAVAALTLRRILTDAA